MMKPFVLGLTGSIGMGKSTTAKMFADAGIPVWDADATVHQIYTGNSPVVQQIAEMYPEAVKDKEVDRQILKNLISRDQSILKKLEGIVQPSIAASRKNFILNAVSDIVIIDHPLLLESKSDAYCDAVLVVTIDADTQKHRVLAREKMDIKTFDIIRSKQMPTAEKRKYADYIIETTTLSSARMQVQTVIRKIREQLNA
mgnify:CR=1 FL=1